MMGRFWRILRAPAGVLCLLLLAAPLSAQDLDPRAYANVPVNSTFLVTGFALSHGGVVTDPTLPVTDIDATIETPSFAVARSFSLFGKTAQACEYVSLVSLAVIATVIFLQILLRNFASLAYAGIEEVARLAHISLVFLLVPLLFREGLHIKIDLLTQYASPRVKQSLDAFAALLTAVAVTTAGSIGFIAPGRQAQFNVAIRTLLLDHATGQCEYGVGTLRLRSERPLLRSGCSGTLGISATSFSRIATLRRSAAIELGLVVPPIRVRDNVQLGTEGYAVKVKGVEVARGMVRVGRYLAINAARVASAPSRGPSSQQRC